MKKLTLITLLFAACKSNSHNGIYVNHTDGQYSIIDDTLEIRDSVIINRTGFQKIRNGKVLPKEFKKHQLFELHPIFQNDRLELNGTSYTKIN